MNFCQLLLTVGNKTEAEDIARALLNKKLIACVKQLSVSSAFWWQGKIENNDEVLLVMDSRDDLFEQVEAEVAKIHSYDTFVLQAVPVTKISKDALRWLDSELNDE